MIRVILADDGRVAVDIELPEGERCSELDAGLRTFLAAMGVTDPSIMDGIRTAAVTDGIPVDEKDKIKGGS